MINNLKKLLVLAGFLLVCQAQAGTWLRNEGDRLYSGILTVSGSGESWNTAGVLVRNACGHSTSQDLNLSIEYGYSYYYTLMAGSTLFSRDCGATGGVSGLGDATLGVRGRIYHELNGKAWELKALIPTGYSNTTANRLGYGRFGLEVGAYFGDQFDPFDLDPYKPGYEPFPDHAWEWGTRVQTWTGAPAAQLLGYVKWYKTLPKQWYSGTTLERDLNIGHGTTELIAGGGTRQPFYDVLRLKVEFKHPLGDGWTALIAPSINLWGYNMSRASAINFGLDRSLSK